MSSEPREPNAPDDRELEDFLQGSSRIGAAYREAARGDTAPRELDTAILAMAREAAATPLRRRPRWIQPLAVAATLALSLGVLLNIWRDPSARQQLAPTAESDADADAALDAAAPASMSVESEAGIAAPVVEQKREASALADADARRRATQPELRKEERPAAKRAPEPVQAGAMISTPRPASAPPAAPPPPPAALEERAAPIDALSAKPETAEPFRAEPPAASAGMNSMGAPAAAAGAMAPAKSREAQRLDALSQRDRAAKRAAPSPSTERTAHDKHEPAEDRIEDITPEQWIEGIRRRIAQGDTAGARETLKDFRAAYPGYALPDDLKPYDPAPPD